MIGCNRKIGWRLRSESGASLVEFAIVLPLFLLLVFGVIEFSLLFYNKAMLTNGAREGARYGVVESPAAVITAAEITTVVKDYCQKYMITFGGSAFVNVNPVILAGATERPYDALSYSEYLKVYADYNYTFLILPNIFKLINATGVADLPSTMKLEAVCQMRAE